MTKREAAELELDCAARGLTAAWDFWKKCSAQAEDAARLIDRSRERLDRAEDAMQKYQAKN